MWNVWQWPGLIYTVNDGALLQPTVTLIYSGPTSLCIYLQHMTQSTRANVSLTYYTNICSMLFHTLKEPGSSLYPSVKNKLSNPPTPAFLRAKQHPLFVIQSGRHLTLDLCNNGECSLEECLSNVHNMASVTAELLTHPWASRVKKAMKIYCSLWFSCFSNICYNKRNPIQHRPLIPRYVWSLPFPSVPCPVIEGM